ncbi:MAG: bifunctional proline dehydrogenase/L-glutamate gamma-semialdehyde dehydrogenase PutA [Pseudomonadota bacterium]
MSVQSFSSYFAWSEEKAVKAFLKDLDWNEARASAVQDKAAELVKAVRSQKQSPGQLEAFLRDYALDTEEGLALMTLAEALLRVPDKATSKMLIHDKVAASNWLEKAGSSQDWVVKAAGVGLFMTSKTLDSVLRKIGEPFVREAMVNAMRILGRQFVLGRDIQEAMQVAQKSEKAGYRLSYDILGEGARTAVDAQHYYDAYAHAIDYIGERAKTIGGDAGQQRPGISVKLSALHPRYEYAQEARCVPEMSAMLAELAEKAAGHNIAMTVDAEESERLNISLKIIESVMAKPSLKGWEGFGLAVQAYQKSAPAVIDHMAERAKENAQRIQMRLVKGAYWDSEIKKAQVEGLDEFPVYTRKSHSDASYIACAAKMLAQTDTLYPMFGTHNAYSVAAIMEMGRENQGQFEFQRLFGMGEALFESILAEGVPASIYAPVGPHEDLLPYLVRRLLENGANSSFVNRILDPDASVEELVSDPVDKSKNRSTYKHPKIRTAKELFLDEKPHGRLNSQGMDLHAPEVVEPLLDDINALRPPYRAAPIIGVQVFSDGHAQDIKSPSDFSDVVGQVINADAKIVERAFEAAQEGFAEWGGMDAAQRGDALERAADLLEARSAEFMALLSREAGKTLPDALAEIREAVDFLRYYASQGRSIFVKGGVELPGPTGESNRLISQGRGGFVCISPWNFPLAIFTGQIAAALMAGNAVISKPAEQTPLVAAHMIALLHEAGVSEHALNLVPGDGRVGALLVQHKDVAGVAFTGSTEVAHEINRSLANKNGPIVPLIAETGGQNAMIVDSSALPEQVIDDVLLSAFGSAGQRCSALRVLCLQSDVADKMIRMLQGAMHEINVGKPQQLSSDLGPVIDEEAHAMLVHHREALNGFGKLLHEVPLDAELTQEGHYFGPCAYEIPDLKGLKREVFGPILHVLRYEKDNFDDLLQQIADTGYGLTLGVHSRIQSFHDYVAAKIPAGNVYVNRSMIGAVVGSQPFGGMGLSGTGPKAGGPHYLHAFAHERVISVDTTAAGGNASLVSLTE